MPIVKYLPIAASVASFTMFFTFLVFLIGKKHEKKNLIFIMHLYLAGGLYSLIKGFILFNPSPNTTLLLYHKLLYLFLFFTLNLLIEFFDIISDLKITRKYKNLIHVISCIFVITIFTSDSIFINKVIPLKINFLNITYYTFANGPLYILMSSYIFSILIFFLARMIYLKRYTNIISKSAIIALSVIIIGSINDALVRNKIIYNIFMLEYLIIIIPIILSNLIIRDIIQNEETLATINNKLILEKENLQFNALDSSLKFDKALNEIEHLNNFTKQISSLTLDFDEIFNRIFNYLSNTYHFEGCYLSLVTDDKKFIKIEKFNFPPNIKIQKVFNLGMKFPVSKDSCRTSSSIFENKVFYFTDIDVSKIKSKFSKKVVEELNIKSVIHIPVVLEDEPIGTLTLTTHNKTIYLLEEDIESIQRFVNQMSAMLRNAKLYKEIKNKSNELEDAIKKAEEANINKSEFIAIISHELRTPLTGILGFSELLYKDKSLDEHEKDLTHRINTLGKKLLVILNDLLELSVIESGKFKIQYYYFNIDEIINDIFIIFRKNMDEKNIVFNKIINTTNAIYSDPQRIRQVLFNLIGNAVKNTKDGNITISINKDHNAYVFKVIDTGKEIKKEQYKNIFESFNQSDDKISDEKGTELLGLFVCKKLITMLGGNIGVDKEYNLGTSIYFSIPFKEKNTSEIFENVKISYVEN